jgi:hypothetical protein
VPSLGETEQLPLAGDALQRMGAAVVELEAGSGHEVDDRAREHDLAGSRKRGDAGADVDTPQGDRTLLIRPTRTRLAESGD